MKYSDLIADLLVKRGYTTDFFVAGGNIMHLIESFSTKLRMIPVLHEVSAVIACDYFNAAHIALGERALALVTLGPGVSNTVTGIASAFVDSREVLLIGGQVKSNDLKSADERQNGLQELDGVSLLETITKKSVRLDDLISIKELDQIIAQSWRGRKGPVFVEICLDVQGREVFSSEILATDLKEESDSSNNSALESKSSFLLNAISHAKRPLILVGAGLPRVLSDKLESLSKFIGIPVATSWNGADRYGSDLDNYAGRPNIFGQRWANIFIQQADVLIVLGSSLGIQQTGFNVSAFAPHARIIHLDIDPRNLENDNLENLEKIQVDLKSFFPLFYENAMSFDWSTELESRLVWLNFLSSLRVEFPLVEPATHQKGHTNAFEVINSLSKLGSQKLTTVTCSSGGTYTSFMQAFETKQGQTVLSSKGLGSMGIGLAGAIGAAFAKNGEVWLFEGDGGFAQNLQELGTVAINQLNIKIVLFSNQGYASIRSTQKRYFSGNYVGCDPTSGLGLPDFEKIAEAYGLQYLAVPDGKFDHLAVFAAMQQRTPIIIEIFLDPEQPYLPKIDSVLSSDGSMQSNPLHLMSPDISQSQKARFFKYI